MILKPAGPALCLAIILALGAACGKPGPAGANQKAAAPTVEVSALERDIESMKTADFEFIYVFRRKDGGPFDGEDKTYLKANSPADTNRFVLSEEEKAVVAGSSYQFEPKQIEKLGERFDIENYSVAKKEENDNQNSQP